jgi:hypothetical protein
MLRRWRSDLLTCRSKVGAPDTCAKDADIVVVPSLYMHGTGFRSVNPWDESTSSDREEKYLSTIDRDKRHRSYWDKVRRAYERPSAAPPVASTGANSSTWPLIVVHYSYVFDATWNVGMIRALAQQPRDFQQRVVLGGCLVNAPCGNKRGRLIRLLPRPWNCVLL